MFFIGIFSSPLPYLVVFSIYLIGIINYSFQAKGGDEDWCVHDKTVKLDKEKIAPASTDKITHFFDHYYQDQSNDQATGSTQHVVPAQRYHTKKYAVYKPHGQKTVFSCNLYIRPPPYKL